MLLDRIAAAREVDGGRDRHCDVISDVPFSLYFMLMTSNVRYVYILHGCKPIRTQNQHRAWDKITYIIIIYNITRFDRNYYRQKINRNFARDEKCMILKCLMCETCPKIRQPLRILNGYTLLIQVDTCTGMEKPNVRPNSTVRGTLLTHSIGLLKRCWYQDSCAPKLHRLKMTDKLINTIVVLSDWYLYVFGKARHFCIEIIRIQ